jgi:hypothetical protein
MSDEYLRIQREVHPACELPDNLDAIVWRYMDYWKFESLLKTSTLYLCRAERLQDKFEGTYSREQMLDMEAWLKSIGVPKTINTERQRRIRDRNRTYVSCWCVGDCDLDLMWKAYIRNPPGVAIRSTVRHLQQVCDKAPMFWPLDISLVRYFDHARGQHINYWGTPGIFLYKDFHFKLDNELRIIHWPNMVSPTPDHISLPVSLADMIVSVVFAPHTQEVCARGTREILDALGLKTIPVEFSRDDRDLIE